jgi:ankyrin repeat protein
MSGVSLSVDIIISSLQSVCRNVNLWTPLNCAAHHGHEKVVRVLIDAGADVNPHDKQPTTPLHLAAQEGHLNVVKVLLANEAEVGRRSRGLNSLDMAIDYGHQ